MKKNFSGAIALFAVICFAAQVVAHCEIPCGIYDDPARIKLMNEHIDTIAKSIQEINHLSEAEKPNYNQLVRWVTNKETHATELQDIVCQYFLTQRLKPLAADDPGYAGYIAKLTVLHKIQVEAMKSKQSADPVTAKNLKALTAEFEKLYFPESGKEAKK